MRVKMSKPPPPAPTASAIGPCPTVIKIVGRPGTGSLPSTIAPPDHPRKGHRANLLRLGLIFSVLRFGDAWIFPLIYNILYDFIFAPHWPFSVVPS